MKNVDFYKSGFPARYGGRLSSVVDVRTADGNMNHFHGAYRIGLLDASVQFEGISLALGSDGDRTLLLGRKDCQGCKGEERKEIR